MAKQKLDWPHDECPECGGAVQIETDCPQEQTPEDIDPDFGMQPPWVYDGDEWTCEDGHKGYVVTDSETPAYLRVLND